MSFLQRSSHDTDDPKEREVTARIKISGPEQGFAYILHFINLITCIVVFTVLMQTVPEYADTIRKVQAASGFSMSVMIYIVCPVSFLLAVLAKIIFHATSETWKVAGSGMKWTKQQLVPKPKSEFVSEKIPLQIAETPETVPAEFNVILDAIHERRN